MKNRSRWGVAAWMVVLAPMVVGQSSSVQEMLDAKALETAYNGVVVDYLLEEGRQLVTADQHTQALDQLVTALKARTQVSQGEQLVAALGTLAGILMGGAADDVGDEVAEVIGSEWVSWVDAADKLLAAGYSEDAIAFYEWGMTNIPYRSLRGRCVMGLAAAKPAEAFQIIMDSVANSDPDLRNEGLRLLGHLAGSEGLPSEQKDAAMATLIEYSEGMTHASNFRAAIYGLDKANDPRAIPALSRFRKGMMIQDEDQRPALRSLLLTYGDESVVEDLEKKLKGGFLSTTKPIDKYYAAVVLMEGGYETGFQWAAEELQKKGGGLFSRGNDNEDLKPTIVNALVRVGGARAIEVLAQSIDRYKDKDWIKTWMAIALLELGDTRAIDLARAALGNDDWDFTAVRVATALARHDDYSGIPALDALSAKSKLGGGFNLFGSSRSDEERLISLKRQIAAGLGEIDRPEGVPVLIRLLGDSNEYVRSSAAYGLAEMTDSAAIDGLVRALTVDYGTYKDLPRSPTIRAWVLRRGLMHHANGAGALTQAAAGSSDPGVRFMAAMNAGT